MSISNDAKLSAGLEKKIRDMSEQRHPTVGSYGKLALATLLLGATFFVEWSAVNIALSHLLEPIAGKSNEAETDPSLIFITLFGILLLEVILHARSEAWSEQKRQWVLRLGLWGGLVFLAGGMALLPTSIWQGNGLPGTDDGNGPMALIGYLALGLVLASLLPLSVVANFAALTWAKAAFAKIERRKALDADIAVLRGLLNEREAVLAAQRAVEKEKAAIPSDDQIFAEHGAHISTVLIGVAAAAQEVILQREAAKRGTTESAPVMATPFSFLNHFPMERLHALVEQFGKMTPAVVRQRMAKELQA